MKKLFLIFICFLFFNAPAQILKGSVNEDYIPEGFYGTWGVISKLQNSNNPNLFNFESRDIWVLSGYSNILILENLQSGARSEIIIKDKSKDVLKFQREKIVENNNKKTIYKETVEFLLNNNTFSGTDNFIIEDWNNGTLVKKNEAKYKVSGVKISGTNPK